MPGHENLSASEIWRSSNPIDYTPAFKYGDPRDVQRIADSSGRTIEEVQAMIESRKVKEVPDYLPKEWEVRDGQREI